MSSDLATPLTAPSTRAARPALAVSDQVLLSAAHFVIGLSVARSGDAAALGLFGIGFLIVNSAADFHRAVIWLPMSQYADPEQFRAARRMSVVMGVLIGGVAAIVAAALSLAGKTVWSLTAAGIAAAVPFYFLHEIQRRIQYALLEPGAAVVAGSVYAATAVAGVVWAPAFTTIPMGPAIRALFILALAGLTSSVASILLLRSLPESKWTLRALASHFAPAGKAYSINAAMVFASQRFSLLLLGSVVGVDAIGRTEAARLLTAPLMVVALGLAAMTVPMVAHAFRDRYWPSMRPLLDRVTFASVIIAAGYGLLLVLGAGTLSVIVFDTVYEGTVALGLMYCGIAAASLVSSTLMAPLGAAGRAYLVPRARVPGVLIVVLAAFPAALYIGEHGVLGLVLIESILSAILLRRAVNTSFATAQ